MRNVSREVLSLSLFMLGFGGFGGVITNSINNNTGIGIVYGVSLACGIWLLLYEIVDAIKSKK